MTTPLPQSHRQRGGWGGGMREREVGRLKKKGGGGGGGSENTTVKDRFLYSAESALQ